MKTLYLSDLDGTLLRSDIRVSGYTASVINRFVQSGGYFSYATARSLITSSKATEGLNVNFPVVCYNGAFIISSQSGELLRANYFTPEMAATIRHTLTGLGVSPVVYAYVDGVERFSFIDHDVSEGMRFFLDERLGDIRRREVHTEDELYRGEAFEFCCISNATQLGPVNEIFAQDARVQCIYQQDIYSNAMWCELLSQDATKANAALQLKDMLGCDKLVVFGDSRNDLSLFSVADQSYAMANALPELKAVATAVIGSNDQDGVARWFEENVL